MCLRDMIDEAKSYELDRSVNARMAISKSGTPLKAVSMHRNCSTPLWKVVVFTVGVLVGLMTVCCIMKKCRYKEVNSEK